jgi:hypothetical protein
MGYVLHAKYAQPDSSTEVPVIRGGNSDERKISKPSKCSARLHHPWWALPPFSLSASHLQPFAPLYEPRQILEISGIMRFTGQSLPILGVC